MQRNGALAGFLSWALVDAETGQRRQQYAVSLLRPKAVVEKALPRSNANVPSVACFPGGYIEVRT